MIRLLSAIGDFIVDGLYDAFRINPMNGAGILKTLRLGSWTAEAVHTDSEQHLRRFRVLFTTVVPISFSSLFLIFCSDYTIIETTRMLLQQRNDDFHEYFFSFQHAAVSWNQRERNLGAA